MAEDDIESSGKNISLSISKGSLDYSKKPSDVHN